MHQTCHICFHSLRCNARSYYCRLFGRTVDAQDSCELWEDIGKVHDNHIKEVGSHVSKNRAY